MQRAGGWICNTSNTQMTQPKQDEVSDLREVHHVQEVLSVGVVAGQLKRPVNENCRIGHNAQTNVLHLKQQQLR